MKIRLFFLFFLLCIVLSLPCIVFASSATTQTVAEDIPYFSTIRKAAEYVRDGLINRSFEKVTDFSVETKVRLPVEFAELPSLAEQFWQIAHEHTGNPKGGDFFPAGGMAVNAVVEDGYCTVYIDALYDWSHEQDKELDAAVKHLLTNLNLSGKSDYEKVRAIYDWMCLNIEYDFTYSNFSAYDALCERKVVCSGYSSLFYRLCLEMGIDCRYCGGYAFDSMWGKKPESHAWNLVRVEGNYYFVDTTWGAGLVNGKPDYYYLLKGINGMADHVIYPDRWDQEIGDYCTVAAEDYPIPERTIYLARGRVNSSTFYTIDATGRLSITGSGKLGVVGLNDINYMDQAKYVREIIIGEGITSIEANAFRGLCYQAMLLSLPDSLTSVGDFAFENCSLLVLKISSNLKQIGKGAFDGRNLQSIEVDPNNPYYTVIDNCLYTKDGKTLVRYAGMLDVSSSNFDAVETYAVAEGTETIAYYAFGGNNILNEVILPNSVKTIEEKAFYLSNQAVVNLPESLVSIGAYAFDGCNAISEVYIGPNVSHIGESALTSFRHTTITVHPDNPYFICVDGVLFSKDMTRLIRYPVAWTDTTYVIPEGVTEIAAAAFSTYESSSAHSANLFSVSFPDSLRVIGNGAFAMQCNLRELRLPSKLEIISDGAFSNGATSLQTIEIPDSVTYVGQGAFWQHGAETIIVGKGVKEIKEQAFHRNNASLNDGMPTNVFFRGERPAMENLLGGDTLFGPTYADKLSTRVYFPKEYTSSWAPNNEVIWKPYADYEEYYPIYAYHESDDGKLHSYTLSLSPSGCSGQGTGKYHCSICGDTYEGANGHAVVTIPGKAATCTEAGLTDGEKCAVCGTITVAQQTIKAKGHTPVTIPGTAATCTEDGLTDGAKCSACGEILTPQEIIPKLPHTFVDGACTVCGAPGAIPGDFTGDELVTNEDVSYLLWHTLFPQDYPLNSEADFTGDGIVTNEDVSYLLWHTLFPNDYPLMIPSTTDERGKKR